MFNFASCAVRTILKVRNMLMLLWREIVSPSLEPEAGGPPVVDYSLLPIQYAQSHLNPIPASRLLQSAWLLCYVHLCPLYAMRQNSHTYTGWCPKLFYRHTEAHNCDYCHFVQFSFFAENGNIVVTLRLCSNQPLCNCVCVYRLLNLNFHINRIWTEN